jgi:transposase
VTAATIMAEIGDLRRFDTPRQLMGYLGLVQGEQSTGETAGTSLPIARQSYLDAVKRIRIAWTAGAVSR